MKDIRITFRLDSQTFDLLNTLALKEGKDVSKLIREAVKRHSLERLTYLAVNQ